MKTIGQHIANIRSSLRIYSADQPLSNRLVYQRIVDNAAQLIKQESNRRRLMSTDTIFSEPLCLDLVIRPASECCDAPVDEYWSVSEEMPAIGEGLYGHIIQGVWNVTRTQSIDPVTPGEYITLRKMKHVRQKPRYFIQKNRIIVTAQMDRVIVSAYFPDPLSGRKCEGCFSPVDQPFPFPSYLEGTLYKIVLAEIDASYRRSREDGKSDAEDTGQ